jgi:hypothetical protein
MSIRQIQYPPIAEPPAFTPPTIPQMGWWGYYPQSIQPFSDRREYRTRGGGYRAFLDTQSHAVFVPERWATPLGAMTETPDNPRQLLRRFLVAAEHPSMFGGPLQNVVATTPLLSMFEGPDDPRLGRKTGVRWPIYPLTEFGVELDDPTESWEGWYPDSLPQLRSVSALRLAAATLDLRSFSTSTPYFLSEYPDDPRLGRRTQLPTSAMFDGSDDGWVSLEQLRWAVEYPNSTRRNSLFTPEQWSYATGTSPEEWDPPALSWRPSLVERVPVLRPQTRINGLSLVL